MTSRLSTAKGHVINGDLESWAAGVPTDFDVDQVNTTVVQLTRAQHHLHLAGQPQFVVQETADLGSPIHSNPLVRSGESALRFRSVAALAAGEWALRSEGIGAAHGGAPTGQVFEVAGERRSVFSFWARGTEGFVIAVNLVIQAAAVNYKLAGNDWDWATAATGLDNLTFALQPEWRRFSIPFFPLTTIPPDIPMVFEITNVSTGAAIVDIDSIEYEIDGPENERPV